MTIKPKISILYLDDELHNLESFKAAYRKDYTIFTTDDPEEAEEILKREEIQIVIADQRMPQITGVEFFEKIRSHHSEPVRILITGYTDIKAAIDSINRGEVFRFIDKPWDHDYVKTAIENAYDIYRTRKELRERNLQLEKAYNELDKFIYSASHDLRAPLMSILGIAQLAKLDTPFTRENIDNYLNLIEQSVKKLDTFILNIIDYYKNSRSGTEINSVDFKQLVEDIKDSFHFIPGNAEVRYDIKIEQEGEFYSDPVKLRIILNNLLGNALKYQKKDVSEKFIKIDIKSTPRKCFILVEDNGIGIGENDLENIFKMFFRGTSQNSGSGIGLYVVNEAVHKLNGNIKVSSTQNNGTTFSIEIPSTPKND
jgi:signal transduction histidine kinase